MLARGHNQEPRTLRQTAQRHRQGTAPKEGSRIYEGKVSRALRARDLILLTRRYTAFVWIFSRTWTTLPGVLAAGSATTLLCLGWGCWKRLSIHVRILNDNRRRLYRN